MRYRGILVLLAIPYACLGAAAAQAQTIPVEYLAEDDAPTELALGPGSGDRFGAYRKPETKMPRLEVDESVFTVELNLAVVSDFRRGGISSSNGKPAFQPSIGVAHRSGLHASVWASNVADNGGANIELDLAFGYTRQFGKVTADVGLIEYIFPGVEGTNYLELQAGLSTEIGPATINANVAYSPSQANIGGIDNIYVGAGFEMPVGKTPLTLFGSIGVENGAFGDDKIDWQLGGSYTLAGFDFGLTYIDSARTFGTPHSGATVVGSLEKSF